MPCKAAQLQENLSAVSQKPLSQEELEKIEKILK